MVGLKIRYDFRPINTNWEYKVNDLMGNAFQFKFRCNFMVTVGKGILPQAQL